MGYLVQKLSGQTFGEFLRTRLFEPLGMTDTAFCVPGEQDGPLRLLLHAEVGRRTDSCRTMPANPLMPSRPKLESGGGGLVSTAHDYMRFCRMMLGGGTLDGVQILSPKTVEMFSMNSAAGAKLLSDLAPAKACSAKRAMRRRLLHRLRRDDGPDATRSGTRRASSSGAARRRPRSGSILRKIWPSCS